MEYDYPTILIRIPLEMLQDLSWWINWPDMMYTLTVTTEELSLITINREV